MHPNAPCFSCTLDEDVIKAAYSTPNKTHYLEQLIDEIFISLLNTDCQYSEEKYLHIKRALMLAIDGLYFFGRPEAGINIGFSAFLRPIDFVLHIYLLFTDPIKLISSI